MRNNVGVDRIVVALRADCDDGFATAMQTKQRWALDGAVDAAAPGAWHWFAVEGLELDSEIRLSWIGASTGSGDRPGALPLQRR